MAKKNDKEMKRTNKPSIDKKTINVQVLGDSLNYGGKIYKKGSKLKVESLDGLPKKFVKRM